MFALQYSDKIPVDHHSSKNKLAYDNTKRSNSTQHYSNNH